MPVTFYPSVMILQDGGWMGIEIDYPPETLVRLILYFVTPESKEVYLMEL